MTHPKLIAWDQFRERYPRETAWLEKHEELPGSFGWKLLAFAQRDGRLSDSQMLYVRRAGGLE